MDLPIKTTQTGFYRGFTKDVTITAKILVGALIIWAVAFPTSAASVLGSINGFIVATFSFWYVYAMAFFVILCFALALWPAAGRLKLGMPDDGPEFTNFSWFSMMFGAGIGIGMLTFATAEPMYHWASNPSRSWVTPQAARLTMCVRPMCGHLHIGVLPPGHPMRLWDWRWRIFRIGAVCR